MPGSCLIEAIVLCGGAGTRLRPIIKNVPKPMADINGRPFMELVLDHLSARGVKRIVLSVGYQRQIIQDHFGPRYRGCDIFYAVEKAPMGTGGALINSLAFTSERKLLVANGDTFFPIALDRLATYHDEARSLLTVALKQIDDTSRFGAIQIDSQGRVIGFKEKGVPGCGYINGGMYVIDRKFLENLKIPGAFSFERDVLTALHSKRRFMGQVFEEYFIDIGVPEDYQRARQYFSSNS